MTVYRKLVLDPLDDTEIEAGWFLCGNDGRFDIWFVPVEPDYEAHVRQNVALSVSAEDARAIVDAALGIGGSDVSK